MSSAGGHGGFELPGLHAVHEFLEKLQGKQGTRVPLWVLTTPFVAALIIFFLFAPDQSIRNFELVLFIAPLWVPILFGKFAWGRFVEWRRYAFNVKQPHILLEIRVPRETRKSPLSMEAFFANIHLTPGEGTWYKKYFLGRTRPWFSFEFVSLGGRVHMYVWTRKTFRHIIETYLYAQYPGVEIVEATDYTLLIDPTKPPYQMWGCEYEKKAPDPFPIKTYASFGMDKMPIAKPEETTDPLAQTIEFLGSLNSHEQLWVHIMIRYTKGEKYGSRKNAKGKQYNWVDEGRELIEQIRESTVKKSTYVDSTTGEVRESAGFPNPTKGDIETMADIGRNTDKLAFDVGMRAVYVAEEGHFRDYIGNFVTQLFRPFSSASQYINPQSLWSESFNDFPWEDPGKVRYMHQMRELLEFARRRSYFHYPYVGPWMQMSTEELASIYHIPSSTVAAPNLPRIQSTTTEAPANLPT